MNEIDLLLPSPQEARRLAEAWSPPAGEPLVLPELGPRLGPALERLGSTLRAAGVEVDATGRGGTAPAAGLRAALEPGPLGPEGYRLEVSPAGLTVAADGEAGLAYALATLEQWVRIHAPTGGVPLERLPGLALEDRPAFGERGVMLDVSRDRVPRMETLLALVDRLASWKINQLQLYTEHTFAYSGHETVWRNASPLTPEEVRRLDDYCRDRFIELVPNQNSFGHLHRWLRHEPYRRLAECPEGVEHPWSEEPEPFSLCPLDPGSLELLADLYDQLLPNFTSGRFNVGLDETFDLGLCRSAAACAERGKEAVYLDFLRQVHRLAAERGRRIQFWGDIIVRAPELIGELPEDVIALEWGYEADHPFAEHARRYRESGRRFLLAPGTGSWNSLAGRTRNTLLNLCAAARHGLDHDALGLLVTDWGDNGHLQPPPVNLPGLAAGAEVAWGGRREPADLASRLPGWLDLHAFADPERRTGSVLLELGDLYLRTGGPNRNGTALFFLLVEPAAPLDSERLRGLSDAGLVAALEGLEASRDRLGRARPGGPDGDLVRRELGWAADLLEVAARIGRARLAGGGTVAELPLATRRDLASRLAPLLAAHRDLWLARSRPGGLDDSARRLERLHEALTGS